MNVYDTVNRLASEIKSSEEYVNYKMAKEAINMKQDLKEQIKKFEKARYDAQIKGLQTGKPDEESLKEAQKLYIELIEDQDAKRYFEAETKFNILIADVNKIIGEAIQDVIKD